MKFSRIVAIGSNEIRAAQRHVSHLTGVLLESIRLHITFMGDGGD